MVDTNQVPQIKLQADKNILLSAVKDIKAGLMHSRLFGVDGVAGWRNAAIDAESKAENAIKAVEDEKP